MNNVQLIGNLAADPEARSTTTCWCELRETRTGKKVARLRLAMSRRSRDMAPTSSTRSSGASSWTTFRLSRARTCSLEGGSSRVAAARADAYLAARAQ